jgi:hypothetical protein
MISVGVIAFGHHAFITGSNTAKAFLSLVATRPNAVRRRPCQAQRCQLSSAIGVYPVTMPHRVVCADLQVPAIRIHAR